MLMLLLLAQLAAPQNLNAAVDVPSAPLVVTVTPGGIVVYAFAFGTQLPSEAYTVVCETCSRDTGSFQIGFDGAGNVTCAYTGVDPDDFGYSGFVALYGSAMVACAPGPGDASLATVQVSDGVLTQQ